MHTAMRCAAWLGAVIGGTIALVALVLLLRRIVRLARAAKRRLVLLITLRFGACPALARWGPARASFLCAHPVGAARGLSSFELEELIFATLPSSEPAMQNLNTLPGEVRLALIRPR